MSLTLAIAVDVVREDGRHLVVRRAPGRPASGFWTPVTGKIEAGESLPEAAAREVLEEVGLLVTVGHEVHRCEAEEAPYLLVWLLGQPIGDADELAPGDEVEDARWVTADEALALSPMFAATRDYYARNASRTS